MNLYLALNNTSIHVDLVRKMEPENILISHNFFKDILMFEEYTGGWYPRRLIIDSGAFSVWTQKGSIDLNKYVSFCKQVKEAVDDYNNGIQNPFLPNNIATRPPKEPTEVYFVNLDVLPGKFGTPPTAEERENSAIKGWENMEYMESFGLKVIHVFHQHEDFKWLHKLKEHSDYIGLSPANDESQDSKDKWLGKCFSIVKTDVKCHGFAVTSQKTLLKFPFYSADSSSWVTGARYAQVPTFSNGKLKALPYKKRKNLNELIHRSENGSVEMIDDSYHAKMREGVRAYTELGKFITKVWDKRGVGWA